jgi:hypothetical protein
MESFQYIMVTNWDWHWDALEKWNHSTIYTKSYINPTIPGEWPEEATTLFIKRSKEGNFEKSWIGKSKGFREDVYKTRPAIRFEVSGLQPIDCPANYRLHANGWYFVHKNEKPHIISEVADDALKLEPPFLSDMMVTKDWNHFEHYCLLLLKLLGIHEIQGYPNNDNKGKADGVFKFENLVVIYDSTLQSHFNDTKQQQTENYVNQLKESKIRIEGQMHTISNATKQVWIITRGAEVKPLYKEDGIEVKEIPYTRLIEVYRQRLQMDIDLHKLRDILKDLE